MTAVREMQRQEDILRAALVEASALRAAAQKHAMNKKFEQSPQAQFLKRQMVAVRPDPGSVTEQIVIRKAHGDELGKNIRWDVKVMDHEGVEKGIFCRWNEPTRAGADKWARQMRARGYVVRVDQAN